MPPPPPPQSRIDKEAFVKRVRDSGLVPPERLELALKQMPATDRGRVIARGLVEQGLLTKFQAEMLLAGRTDGFVMGQYRVLDELGKGGMGRVFKAEHMTMGRLVALKILNSNVTKSERVRQMFHREVKAAARLNHPNIVTAFDANQLGDRCFLVMEFVDGPNLHDLVKAHGPLPVAQACDYVRQAAVGLQYAHDLGMVHRDIKPANLLVQKTTGKAASGPAVVKILDFGLARLTAPEAGELKSADSIHTNDAVMGTPDFLSPEQARSLHAVDGRSDVYSLGCTLYYLLTARPPFPGGTTMEKLVRHSTDAAAPVNDIRPEVPTALAAVVATMMAKKPEDRYPSAAEAAAALAPFAGREAANWVAVDPLPADNVLPVSSRTLPAMPPGDDPWANIDDGPNSHGTLSDEAATTTVGGSGPRRRPRPAGAPDWVWPLLAALLVLAVGGGVFLALRLIFFKA